MQPSPTTMISEELKMIIDTTDEKMDESVEFLTREFSHIRAGKATPALLDGIKVDYYGAQTPLIQLANVSAPEPRMLTVEPYDKSVMADIEKAIMASNLGLNPNNDGSIIRIPMPMLSEERRKELVKLAKDKAEQARVSVRNARRDANDEIKKTVAEESLPEDSRFEAEEEIQKVTDGHTNRIDELLQKKESEIMTV